MEDEAMADDRPKDFRGELVSPADAGYDEARQLYNGMIDKRPLLIARCVDAADVIAAVNFGRDNKVPIAIRGGGHNGPGLGGVDDGLVIDLSMMKGVRTTRPSGRSGPGPVASPATSTTPPMRSARRSRSGLSRPPASRA